MPKYKSQWSTIPSSVMQPLLDNYGSVGALVIEWGARPREDFVQENWALLRDTWLASDTHARARVAQRCREAGLGEVGVAEATGAYFETLRNTKNLRLIVLDEFRSMGEPISDSDHNQAHPVCDPAMRAIETDPTDDVATPSSVDKGARSSGREVVAGSPIPTEDPVVPAPTAMGASEPPAPAANGWRRILHGEASRERDVALDQLTATLVAAAAPDGYRVAWEAKSLVLHLRTVADLKDKDWDRLRADVMTRATDQIFADDTVTASEEQQLDSLMELLELGHGVSADAASRDRVMDALQRITVAQINSRDLPAIDPLVLRPLPGETVYLECPAILMKEQALKEFCGGTAGVSLRVAKGVTVRTGAIRGHMVPVGTEIVPVTTGTLAVSDRRAIFIGDTETLEFKLSNIVGIQLHTDAITLSVSNRQTPGILKCAVPLVVAAVITAAINRTG